MRLDDKSKLAEALLCDSDVLSTYEALRSVTNLIGLRYRLDVAAKNLVLGVRRDWGRYPILPYREERITAAYRLIESSPRLRKEWFGR